MKRGPTPGNLPEDVKEALSHRNIWEPHTARRPGQRDMNPAKMKFMPDPQKASLLDENTPLAANPSPGELTEGRPHPTKDIPAGEYQTENDRLHAGKDQLVGS